MTEPTSMLDMIAKECHADTERWFPETNNIPFMTLSMMGEAGEVANYVKKVMRGTHTLKDVLPELKEEVVDVFIYLMNLAHLLDLDLEEGYYKKRLFNEERFGK